MTPPRDPGRSDADRCPPAADLTAFATDALPDARRAAISRHLLRCPACRAQHDGAASLLQRLRAASSVPTWTAEVCAAELAGVARARARRRGALAGAAAAAALVLALLAVPTGPRPGRERLVEPAVPEVAAAPPATRLDPDARAALLRAQADDGRWSAPPRTGDHDEGATGLAVLALLAERPDALADRAVAQAVGRATRWLAAHPAEDEAGRRGPSPERDQALATAALLEVLATSGDGTLRPAVDRAVRALARRSYDASDASRDAWTRRALGRARELGWRGRAFGVVVETASAPWPFGGDDVSMCAQALAVLTPRG